MLDDWGTRCPRWTGIRSEVVELHGTRVHTLRGGDDVDGLPQLLVHGLGGSASNWLEVLPALARRGPVLAPDLPGFGRTEPPRTHAARVTANARFLAALVARVGWERVEVHGNSMGGQLSVLLAGQEPERVARMVLVSPALPAALRDAAQLDPATFRRFGPFLVPGIGTLLMKRAYARTTPEQLYSEFADYLHADRSRVSPELEAVALENVALGRDRPWRLPAFATAAQTTVRAVTSRRALEQAIAAVTAPTLVVWGERDRLIGRPVIERIRALRPDWRIAVLDGVGHVPMVEAPERYLEVVDAWHGEIETDGDAAVTGPPRAV